jgi:hypothetical protein
VRLPTFVSTLALVLCFRTITGCSPADWAAVNAAGSTVGAAVDTFALVRAEQIRAKGAAASEAAARGDTARAMAELNTALAALAAETLEELQTCRAGAPTASSAAPPEAP